MRKRTLAALLALTAVVAFVAILPRTPPGRAWLLGRLTSALDRAGVSVSYRRSAGNVWAGVRLSGAEIRAPGVSMSARTLNIHYFLPSLLTGDLPLSVVVDGLRGSVNVDALPSGGAAGGLPVRLRLHELSVSDATVSVQQVPYTLPSGAVSHVRIRQAGSALQVDAQVTTSDGSAEVTGTLDLTRPRFDGRVVRADVRLARHWFNGADGGTVSGPLQAGPDGVKADLALRDGSLNAIGLQPRAIHGSVQLDYPLIRADVQGSVLGGDVSARGVVNIAARHWTAHVQGGTRLRDTALWLARGSLAAGGALPLDGTATTVLDASGWTAVHVSGNAAGSGSLAALPLSELQADYSYDTEAGVKVHATGRVAGGAAVVSAATGRNVTTIEASARQMAPLPGQRVDLRAHLALGPSGPSGAVHADAEGSILGRRVSLTLDGGLNRDGWQALLHGRDRAGATLQGAVALAGADLSGEVRVRDLTLPAVLEPLTASLRADGKLTALRLGLTVDGGPVRVGSGGEVLDTDLAGAVSATLEGTRLTGIAASLGPLTLSGGLSLVPFDGRLAVAMAPTDLVGPVRARLAVDAGSIVFANGVPTAHGSLRLGAVRAGPVRVPPLTLDVGPATGTAPGGTLISARDQGLRITLAGGRAQADFHGFAVRAGGIEARLDGSMGVPLHARPLMDLSSDLTAAAMGATLTAKGRGHVLAAELRAPPGTKLGPLTLARPLAFGGTIDAVAGTGTLRGNLGDVPLHATLALTGGGDASLSAASSDGTMTFEGHRGNWRAHGSMDVGPLASALGLPVRGHLSGDLARRDGAFTGDARLDASAPLDAGIRLAGDGETLKIALSSTLLGRRLTAAGTLLPDLVLTASAGQLGPVTLRSGQVEGSGLLPAQELGAGASLGSVDWRVRGTLSPLSIDLDLGSAGGVHLDAAAGVRLAAAVRLPIGYGDRSLTLDLATAGSGPILAAAGAPAVRLGAGLADLPLSGRLLDASGTTLASFSGNPTSLGVQGSLPAALLAAPLPAALSPAGDIAVSGNARLAVPRRLHLDGTWKVGAETLTAKVSSSQEGTSVSLNGAGLSLDVEPGRAALTADAVRLAPLLPELPVEPVVDGALSLRGGTYAGAMHVTVDRSGFGRGTASATLTGDGSRLDGHVTGTLGALSLEARGPLLPAPRLHGELRAWGGAAALSADTLGPWSHLAVAGTITTRALAADPWVRVPPQRLSFRADTATGAISVVGDSVTLGGTLSDVRGELRLPFRALGGDERLDVSASGPLASPRLHGTLDGPLAGTLAGDARGGLNLDVAAARQALASLLPLGGALASEVRLAGDVHPSGAWHGTVRGVLATAGRRLAAEAVLDGAAADYTGTLTVTPAPSGNAVPTDAAHRGAGQGATLARAALEGSGAHMRATVDLSRIDYARLGALTGVPLQLDATGALTLETAPLAASVRIDARGTAAGHPLSLSGHARGGDISLDAAYGALQLHAVGDTASPVQLSVRAPAVGVELQGSIAAGASPTLTLDGTAAGAPANLAISADVSAREGHLTASLGGATLRADATTEHGVRVTASANAPGGALAVVGVPWAGTLSIDAADSSGQVALRNFELKLSGGATPLSAALSGPLYPEAKLSGTLAAPAWNATAGLSLVGPPTAFNAALTFGGFRLLGVLHGRRVVRLMADGSARIDPFGRTTTITANGLRWDERAGFAGGARVTLEDTPSAIPGTLALALSGNGPLAVTSTLGPSDDPWAELQARLPADPRGADAWHGGVRLDLPLNTLARLPGQAQLTLRGTPAVAGSLFRPTLHGPVAIAGAAQADGTVSWDGSRARVDLSGGHLTLHGELQGGAWRASAALDQLPLEPFTPALAGARASLEADLQGGTDTGVRGSLSKLELTAPGAKLTGTATVQKGIRVAMQVSADLSAMKLPGPPLSGVVHGPLVLATPDLARPGDGTLIALLDVAHLGPRGVNAAVDGSFQVGGSLAAPAVTATLQGSGEVHGQLRAAAALDARRLDLHSTLSYRDLATDLNVSVHDGTVEATGHASYGDAEVHVSTTTAGALAIQGANALEGWQASVPASLATATLSGPLDGLGAGAEGHLSLTLGGRPWLDGAVRSAAVGGIALGDLALSSATPGSPVRLSGTHLRARIDPISLDWQADLEAQPLPGGATVSGGASGRAATGSARLDLAGTLAGAPLSVSVVASRQQDLTVDARGKVLAGRFDAHLARPSSAPWQGSVALQGAAFAGLMGTVNGSVGSAPDGGPELDATAELQGALTGSASVRASLRALTIDGALGGDMLGGRLTASGRLAPTLDLALSTTNTDIKAPGGLRLHTAGGALRGDGRLHLRAGPTRLTLTGGGDDGPLTLALTVPALPGLAFQGPLPIDSPLHLLQTLRMSGLSLVGTDATDGTLTLSSSPTPHAELKDVALNLATLRLSASGTVSARGAELEGAVALPAGLPVDELGGTSVPYRLGWQAGTLTLTSNGPTGHVQARFDPSAGSGHLTAELHTLGAQPGTASVDVRFDPATGAGGKVKVAAVKVSRPDLPGLTVDADVTLGSGKASGTVEVSSAHGGLRMTGGWGLADLLPAAMAPAGEHGGNAELRVNTFDLTTLPTLQRVAPHLTGSASGVIRLRDSTVVGQVLVPDLQVADTVLPLDAQLTGTLGKLDARVKLGKSLVSATLEPGAAKGLLHFQSFPAQVLAEAETGPTDIRAEVDGVMRFDVPYRDPASAYLRMATQRVTLERAGVTTTGNLSWVYNDRAVTVTDAAFEGRGSWQAKGTVDASTLDFQLSASDADFTPLLDLVPVFARYGVGASGSFDLNAKGSPAAPDVTLEASGVEARVAGTHYRVEQARAALKGRSLTGSAHVVGVAPLGGSVDVDGSAHLSLAPPALSNADFNFSGSAELPVVGTVTDLSGGITQQQDGPVQLALSGRLGNPFTIRGSLAPFDVTLKGKALDLAAAPLFITSSTVDADVQVKGGKGGLAIGGELDASEVHMNIGAPSAPGKESGGSAALGTPGAGPTPGQGGTGGQASSGPGAPAASTDTARPSLAPGGSASTGSSASGDLPAVGDSGQSQAARAALESVIFDHLRLNAPQRVLLDAGFGHAEASLDLTLTGTAASPKLDGQARALRGTLTFAGRDFTIDQATARFQASRGVYPTLDVQAHTEFDKQRAIGSATDLTFAAPRDSSTFQVTLSFSGQVQPAQQGPSPVTFDIQPTLSSNALVQSTTVAGTTSPRPLNDSELLSLVTLGRLGVTPQLAGQSAFGTAVAQSALDTAVDVLIVSELQNALSKALGIDVVQIQTTPLSSLLENNGRPFGVALRLGGYLTPDLFASYRLGNYNGGNGAFGFSNEVNLSYDLGPLNVDLSGRLSFPEGIPDQGVVPELGVGLRYAFTTNLGLEAGVDLSDVRRQARFGVSVHW